MAKKGILERLREDAVLEEARQCLQAVKAGAYPAMITFTLRQAETAESDVRATAEARDRRPPASVKSADLARHPGIQQRRTFAEMAGRKPKSPDAPRFETGDRGW